MSTATQTPPAQPATTPPTPAHDATGPLAPKGFFGNRFKEALDAAEKTKAPEPKPPEPPKPEPAKPVEPALTAKEPVKKLVPDLKDTVSVKVPEQAKTAVEPPKETVKEPAKGSKEYNFRLIEAERERLAALNNELSEKVKTLETQLSSVPKADATQLAAIQKQLDEANTLINTKYLEAHPTFKAAFDDKINQAINEAKEIVGAEKANDMEHILRMPEGAAKDRLIREISEELDSFQTGQLAGACREVKKLSISRAAELAKANENRSKLGEMESLTKAQETTQGMKERQTWAEAALVEASGIYPEFKPIAGNDDYNKLVEENYQYVRSWMGQNLNPADQAKVSVLAVRGIRASEREAAHLALIRNLQDTIAKLQGAQPNLEASREAPPKPAPVTPESVAARFRDYLEKNGKV